MKRIKSFDLARGFTVLFIPSIHSCMLYSHPSIHTSLPGKFFIAIAEGPGAQLFMVCLGINFTFRNSYSTAQIFRKAITLLAAGYVLNILKFSIPFCLEALPKNLLHDLAIGSDETALQQLSGIGDILHFASFALLLLHGIYKCKRYYKAAFLLAILITCCSPFLWDLQTGNELLDYIIRFANGQPPQVFFPLLPWLVYPLTGLCIGYYFQHDQYRTIMYCGMIGALLLTAGLASEHLFPAQNTAGFYRTLPAATLWHTGIVLLSLFAWYLINELFSNNLFFRLLTYSSRNITALYIIQWVIIFWLLPVFGYQKVNMINSVIVMLAITINTYLITFTFQLLKQHYGRSKKI